VGDDTTTCGRDLTELQSFDDVSFLPGMLGGDLGEILPGVPPSAR
jgi:hypothetical protein